MAEQVAVNHKVVGSSPTFPAKRYRGVVQLGERLPHDQKVASSNLVPATKYAGLAQLAEQAVDNR